VIAVLKAAFVSPALEADREHQKDDAKFRNMSQRLVSVDIDIKKRSYGYTSKNVADYDRGIEAFQYDIQDRGNRDCGDQNGKQARHGCQQMSNRWKM
jgi:hypothetical protein